MPPTNHIQDTLTVTVPVDLNSLTRWKWVFGRIKWYIESCPYGYLQVHVEGGKITKIEIKETLKPP